MTPFDNLPTLVGELVIVRPLEADDHDALYSVASDPLIWEQHDEDRHRPDVFETFFAESLKSGGALIVEDAETGAVIGSSRYYGYDESLSEVEIGWTFLARSHWGGRYNGELKQLMLDHAFQFVDSVIFYISPMNVRSQRAVEKVGGIREPGRDQPGRWFFRIQRSSD